MAEQKSISLPSETAEWVDNNNLNLSQFTQEQLNDLIAQDSWETGEYVVEPGVTIGQNILNGGSKILYDRFNRAINPNWVTIGRFDHDVLSPSLHTLTQRHRSSDFSNTIVCIDPFGDMFEYTPHDVNRVCLDGDDSINPLRLCDSPLVDSNVDLGSAKMKYLDTFFNMFFNKSDKDIHLNEMSYSTVLDHAISKAYSRAGIDLDRPSSFDNGEATIQDHLIPALRDLADSAEKIDLNNNVSLGAMGINKIETIASELLVGMVPLTEGGNLSHMGGVSDLVIDQGGMSIYTVGGLIEDQSLSMFVQHLFDQIFTWSKSIDDSVIIAVDCSRLLLDGGFAEYVERVVRHSRHYKTSIQLHFDSLDLFRNTHGESIWHQMGTKIIHPDVVMDNRMFDRIQLNQSQLDYLKSASAGDSDSMGDTKYTTVAAHLSSSGWYPLYVDPNIIHSGTEFVEFVDEVVIDGDLQSQCEISDCMLSDDSIVVKLATGGFREFHIGDQIKASEAEKLEKVLR